MSDERIFDPTPQRIARAKREGNVARSASLVTVVTMLGGFLLLWWYGAHLVESLGQFLRTRLASAPQLELSVSGASQLGRDSATWMGQLLLPILICAFAVAIVANWTQGGWVWAPQRVSPDLQRLHPGKRLTSMFSTERLFDASIELLKMGVCLSVAAVGLWSNRTRLAVGSEGVFESFAGATECIFQIVFLSLAALGVISLAEYWLATSRHRRSLRMTAEEYQAEMKDRAPAMSVKRPNRYASGDASSDADA